MNKTEILNLMQDYIVEHTTYKEFENFGSHRITDFLVSSLDIVYFAVDLEEQLGLKEDTLDIEVWAVKFDKSSFDEVADELQKILTDLKN